MADISTVQDIRAQILSNVESLWKLNGRALRMEDIAISLLKSKEDPTTSNTYRA